VRYPLRGASRLRLSLRSVKTLLRTSTPWFHVRPFSDLPKGTLAAHDAWEISVKACAEPKSERFRAQNPRAALSKIETKNFSVAGAATTACGECDESAYDSRAQE